MDCSVCGQSNPESARFCQSCGAPLAQAAEGGDELIGQVIGGRYRVTRVIGEGGMGVVYEAEQQMGPHVRRVAIKTLLPSLSADHTIVSRFYRESGVVAQLEHPNTIRFYDFGETPDHRLYIAMEYVDGAPLTDAIAAGPMPIDRVLHILRQVSGALAEAHGLGVIHRDLKPDNIILTRRAGEDDFVKVLDFGIAKTTGAESAKQTKLTQQGVVLGTPPYMSPEQLAGKELDARSDVYSLGVIAFEMITGRLPFEADTPWQWATHHMTTPPPPMRSVTTVDVPADVERAVMHALAKSPDARPSSALDFYRELASEAPAPARTEPGVDGPHTAPMQPALRPSRRETEMAVAPPAYATGAALAAPIRPPPPRRKRSSGLLIGTLGLVLGGAFAAFAYFQYQQRPAPAPTAARPTFPAPELSITPEGEPPTLDLPAPEPESPKPKPKSKPKPTATPKPKPAPQPAPTPSPTPLPPPPQPTPAPQPTPTPPPSTGPQGDAACGASRQAAQRGNIEGAAALYQQCQKTGGSASALGAARMEIERQAPNVVRNRAFRGDCAGAKSAANAAASVGAGARAQSTYGSVCAGK